MSQPQPARVPPIIQAKLGFTRLSNPDLELRLEAIVRGSYEIRYGATDANRAPGELTTIAVGSARAAVSIDGLTPGIVYVFEVHALGKLGYTDWSNPVYFMCT